MARKMKKKKYVTGGKPEARRMSPDSPMSPVPPDPSPLHSLTAFERAPEVYKIHSQQLAKEAAASGQKGTLREADSPFKRDIKKVKKFYELTGQTRATKKAYQRAKTAVEKAATKTKEYFGFKHGGKTRHSGGLEQHD